MATYKILRFRFKEDNEIIKTGLTLEQAQEHCQRKDTHEKNIDGNINWFDGYTKE